MRYWVHLAIFLAFPSLAIAQEDDFQISAEVRAKQFLFNNVPDIIKNDYRDYDGNAGEELGIAINFHLFSRLNIKAYPYFWFSAENHIARIGLWGELNYGIWEDRLKIGYGHHSWHNADIDSPDNDGRAQDWIFADFLFWQPEISESFSLEFHLKPRLFVNNKEPIALKELYSDGEETAFAETMLRISGEWRRLNFDIDPYVQFASGIYRYGIHCETSFKITEIFSIFSDFEYYNCEDYRLMVSFGILLKFK